MNIVELREDFFKQTISWTDRLQLTGMGYINNLVYCAAKDNGAILNDKKIKYRGFAKQDPRERRKIRVNRRKMREFAKQKTLTVAVPITYTQEYLKKHWRVSDRQRASTRMPYLRDLREMLAEKFELFTFDVFKFGQNPGRMPTLYDGLNLKKALLLYEHLEELYLSKCDRTLESLPAHRGSVMRLIYNWVFKPSTTRPGYRRDVDPDCGWAIENPVELWDRVFDVHFQGFQPMQRGGGLDISSMSKDELDGLLPY